MKKIILLSIILSFTFSGKSQQDAQYNLYQFNQLLINPAYAGARDILSAIVLSRQQWVGIDGAPKTNCLSLHGPVINKNIGVGLTITNDEMGPPKCYFCIWQCGLYFKDKFKNEIIFRT